MGSGRKKSEVKAPQIKAPPQITSTSFVSPTGDQYNSKRSGSSQMTESLLAPETRSTVQTGMQSLRELAEEIRQPDAVRVQDIANRARDFYNLQAKSIHENADEIFSKAASNLSKRFGGTYNATFGTDYLSRLEKNRSEQLSSAAKEARLLGEDLFARDEQSRLQRFNLFHGYLTDKYNEAANIASMGSGTLQNEASRAQNLAIARANLAMEALRMNQEAALQRQASRAGMLTRLAPLAVGVAAAPFTGGASLSLALGSSEATKLWGN